LGPVLRKVVEGRSLEKRQEEHCADGPNIQGGRRRIERNQEVQRGLHRVAESKDRPRKHQEGEGLGSPLETKGTEAGLKIRV